MDQVLDRVPGQDLEYRAEEGRDYYRDEPYTGMAFWLGINGQLRSEQQYRHGLAWGIGKKWHPTGILALEANSYRGVYHGICRRWHNNGKRAEESLYELGVCTSKRQWDENGTVISDYHLE